MDAHTFQAALQATARIACCAVLISCQKQATPESPPMQEHAQQEAAQPSVKEDTTPQRPPPSSQPTRELSPEYLACNTLIKEADKHSQENNTRPSESGADVIDCCNLQIEEITTLDKNPFEWENHNFCCTAMNWQGSMACTPWGPPTPPAMV